MPKRRLASSGLSPRAFGVYWTLRDDVRLAKAGIDPMALAKEAQILLERYPNAHVNPEEQRQLRTGLYRPLLALAPDELKRVVEQAIVALAQN